jgi:hypothetical protein
MTMGPRGDDGEMSCPDAETLQRFLEGKLPVDRLDQHLASCALCRAVVQELRAVEPEASEK